MRHLTLTTCAGEILPILGRIWDSLRGFCDNRHIDFGSTERHATGWHVYLRTCCLEK
jgi:hypothetical protein